MKNFSFSLLAFIFICCPCFSTGQIKTHIGTTTTIRFGHVGDMSGGCLGTGICCTAASPIGAPPVGFVLTTSYCTVDTLSITFDSTIAVRSAFFEVPKDGNTYSIDSPFHFVDTNVTPDFCAIYKWAYGAASYSSDGKGQITLMVPIYPNKPGSVKHYDKEFKKPTR